MCQQGGLLTCPKLRLLTLAGLVPKAALQLVG